MERSSSGPWLCHWCAGHAEGARRLLGGGLALALVLVGLSASSTDLVIALLFALAGPAWALWTTDRVIAKARQLAEDRRHSELFAAVKACGTASGGRASGCRLAPVVAGRCRCNGRTQESLFPS